jgi:hypothetical protein
MNTFFITFKAFTIQRYPAQHENQAGLRWQTTVYNDANCDDDPVFFSDTGGFSKSKMLKDNEQLIAV